ncbi:MAG: vitamin B12 dependent-methionine synthase activation domain-containing protein [Hominenteromicrobium sp.]
MMKLNEKETLRYLGFRGRPADAETLRMVDETAADLLKTLTPKCVWRRYPAEVTETAVTLDGWRIESEKLAHHLRGCRAAYLFAATLGVQADRRIRQLSAGSAARGAVANAVCSALIESYCDEMQAKLAETEAADGLYLRPRFSPGYGDFALESQREIFLRLECEKRIGVTLTDALLMTPFKSVSAVIGVTDVPDCTYRRCRNCGKTDCAFRTDGET